ncbi:glycosyltransferase family 2 protein [Paenibacillus methanolicus]|uniref:GT2 family glycosyltransferase n=1 Tax=Paenibacillus methanolicus TaxID=582686 RepID=A0A5S5CBL5_9BACL|nr:glycosyltransferase [Paenibacillus methanolicus]TYP75736.1 GT2 family glycosyltransferase [Paenibacillus methanolicus]
MNTEIATHSLELLQGGYEGVIHLQNCIRRGELNAPDIAIFETMGELLDILEKSMAEADVPHRVPEINANLRYYLDGLMQDLNDDQVDRFLYDFRFHFYSLYRVLEFEIAYIVERHVDKEAYPRFYPEIVDVDHHEIVTLGEEAGCKVSVVLLAYNNLAVTRDCVDSIIANMGDMDYELVLVDNGSTDGTKAYFDSVPGAKVIHLKYNIHLVKGFNMGLMAAEGRYTAAVCNDFIFTSNWIHNLMACIESDPQIGYVSPGATSISNMQQIDIPFVSIADFQERARAFNISNPSKWEERVVLLPNVLCCRTALLEKIGYYDTRFYRGEFLDDDISFKIRRAGYKLVYCADTVTHHYGSLTTTSDHLTGSLEEGRRSFFDKYGLDAWQDARMDSTYLEIDRKYLSGAQTLLGVDVKCGATFMQIKNRIWSEFGIQPDLRLCTTEPKYETDLRTLSDDVSVIERLDQLPEVVCGKLDLIYIEKPLDTYPEEASVVFGMLARMLADNGSLIFYVTNNISIEAIFDMLNASASLHNRRIYVRNMLLTEARKHGFGQAAVMDFIVERGPQATRMIESVAKLLSGNQETQARYIVAAMKPGYAMYQLKLEAIPD